MYIKFIFNILNKKSELYNSRIKSHFLLTFLIVILVIEQDQKKQK